MLPHDSPERNIVTADTCVELIVELEVSCNRPINPKVAMTAVEHTTPPSAPLERGARQHFVDGTDH